MQIRILDVGRSVSGVRMRCFSDAKWKWIVSEETDQRDFLVVQAGILTCMQHELRADGTPASIPGNLEMSHAGVRPSESA